MSSFLLLTDRLNARSLFPAEVGRLHIEGKTFRTSTGALWQWRGYSWFLGFLRYCRGEDITPDLRWMRAFGFNIPRVFGPLPWKETPDYRLEGFDFRKFDAFLSLLESYGLRCNFSVGHYPHSGWASFDQQIDNIASGHWNLVKERVNEPHVGQKPDPLTAFASHRVLTSYGLYGSYYAKPASWPPTFDFGTVHVSRDSAWHRKARHVQELQQHSGKPWVSDEPAKITEPHFDYPGGKNDPATTPAEMVWHAGVCCLYTAGCTVHTEEGKWGRVPTPGMLQHTVCEAVRDHVWTQVDASWQTGGYMGSHLSASPVDHIDDVWTYSSMHGDRALSVRCAFSAPQPQHSWRVIRRWGPAGSLVELAR